MRQHTRSSVATHIIQYVIACGLRAIEVRKQVAGFAGLLSLPVLALASIYFWGPVAFTERGSLYFALFLGGYTLFVWFCVSPFLIWRDGQLISEARTANGLRFLIDENKGNRDIGRDKLPNGESFGWCVTVENTSEDKTIGNVRVRIAMCEEVSPTTGGLSRPRAMHTVLVARGRSEHAVTLHPGGQETFAVVQFAMQEKQVAATLGPYGTGSTLMLAPGQYRVELVAEGTDTRQCAKSFFLHFCDYEINDDGTGQIWFRFIPWEYRQSVLELDKSRPVKLPASISADGANNPS